MHMVPTERLLPRQLRILPRYIKEAIHERGKCYLRVLVFLCRVRNDVF